MLINADARSLPLADESVQCVVTSPPYWGLRDYGVAGQIGLEKTPEEYVATMVSVFREVRRVLKKDGVVWLNLGDSYASSTGGGIVSNRGANRDGCPVPPGLKPKDLVGIPWRVAFALQADGWWLRSDIIWAKPNPMPESVTDRPTRSHEYLFLLTKAARYRYDADAIREPNVREWGPNNGGSISTGRMVAAGGAMGDMSSRPKGYPAPNPLGANRRSVWTIATQPFSGVRLMRGASGGIGRTVSPDCSIHGALAIQESTDRHDAQRGASDPGRNPGNDSRPGSGRSAALSPTQMHLDGDYARGNSDSPDHMCSKTASARNTGNRRTDPSLSISPHEIADAGSESGTGGRKPPPGSFAMFDRTPENRSAQDSVSGATEKHPSDRTAYDTDRKCTCQYDSTVSDHFAVFPEKLVEPCVLAGSRPGDTVLDPFAGSGTVGRVCTRFGREFVGVELNASYIEMASRRTSNVQVTMEALS